MGIRADFRGFPYPAPSDGRSAELGAFWWLLETSRAEPSQLFDLGRHWAVDDAARTVIGSYLTLPTTELRWESAGSASTPATRLSRRRSTPAILWQCPPTGRTRPVSAVKR